MKTTVFKTFLVFLFVISIHSNAEAQVFTTATFPVGKVLAAGAAGLALPSGNRVYVEKISLGAGVHGTNSGDYGTDPIDIGGILNGDISKLATGASATGNAITLSSFEGEKLVTNFTRIEGQTYLIDSGYFKNYYDAIGYHIYFDAPVSGADFEFLDVDGNSNSTSGSTIAGSNSEWVTAFGFNNDTLKRASFDFNKGPGNLTDANVGAAASDTSLRNPLVAETWNDLVKKIKGPLSLSSAAAFRTASSTGVTTPNPAIFRRLGTTDTDPDETSTQVRFYFPNNEINHFYTLWGVTGATFRGGSSTASTSGTQNSGISGLKFNLPIDFGDAPDTYGTANSSGGAAHGIYKALSIGKLNLSNNSGVPGINADGDAPDEDGVTLINDINSTVLTGSSAVASYSVKVQVFNNMGTDAQLFAWIDWNNNNTFEASEAVSSSVASSDTGYQLIKLDWSARTIDSVQKEKTYLRLRLSTDPALTSSATVGYLPDGEVEDYMIPIKLPPVVTPLKLLSFEVQNNGQNIVNARWSVADIKEVEGLNLERSFTGQQFESIYTEKNFQITNSKIDFSFLDNLESFSNLDVFYRLRIIDKNNKFTFSPTKMIKLNADRSDYHINLFPNPTSGTIEIQNGPAEGIIKVFNSFGLNVFNSNFTNNQSSISISNLPNGLYLLEILNEKEKFKSFKTIIKN